MAAGSDGGTALMSAVAAEQAVRGLRVPPHSVEAEPGPRRGRPPNQADVERSSNRPARQVLDSANLDSKRD